MTFQGLLLRYRLLPLFSWAQNRLANYFLMQIFLYSHPSPHILQAMCSVGHAISSHLCDSGHVVFYVCGPFLLFLFCSPLKVSLYVISWEAFPGHPTYSFLYMSFAHGSLLHLSHGCVILFVSWVLGILIYVMVLGRLSSIFSLRKFHRKTFQST